MNSWSEYVEESRKLKKQIAAAPTLLGFSHPPVFEAATGMLLVVDWDGGRILAGGGKLYVATWGGDDILILQGNDVVGRIQHPWLNAPHSVEVTSRGLLVTSSGTDVIMKIDDQGRVLWDFLLFERGYSGGDSRLGRHFDRSRCYNHMYLPSSMGVHPNSAILTEGGKVLATLFGPGELVRIEPTTGAVEVLLSGLRRPHAIRRRPDGGYVLCDTEGGRVVLLDDALRPEGEVPVPAPWIQDAAPCGDRLLVVGNRQVLTEATPRALRMDAVTTNSVLEITMGGMVRRRLDLGREHRLYMVSPIPQEDAIELARAWTANSIDMSWMSWETYYQTERATAGVEAEQNHAAL
jgi:hypothetical protein